MILQTADQLINGPRKADYGHALDNFTQIGRIWGALLNMPDIKPETVGLMMTGLKLARETENHKVDNLVDAAGYVGTVEQVIDERHKRNNTGIYDTRTYAQSDHMTIANDDKVCTCVGFGATPDPGCPIHGDRY